MTGQSVALDQSRPSLYIAKSIMHLSDNTFLASLSRRTAHNLPGLLASVENVLFPSKEALQKVEISGNIHSSFKCCP